MKTLMKVDIFIEIYLNFWYPKNPEETLENFSKNLEGV